MSQRRAERSRTSQPLPTAPTHSNSSSSISSTRADRITRSNHRQQSSNKSSTPRSLSSEEGDEPPSQHRQSEPPQTRRRTRQQDHDDDPSKIEDDIEDGIAEEEEITRCICGEKEYPGPPTDSGKSKDNQPLPIGPLDPSADEAGGLFIQCDKCEVWQHGGCVGIMEEAACPDEYFCEQCRPDLHKVLRSAQGQKYSLYNLVQKKSPPKQSARKSSIPKDSEDKIVRDKDRAAAEAKKRRSTMNSRHAVDEDEVLRKVMEESRTDAGTTGADDAASRRTKRSRDDSEDNEQDPKRIRTSSRSPPSSIAAESEDETPLAKQNGKAKPRGAAAKSQREKELRDKEREREKAEAASKRKGRAERRRADDAEQPDDPIPPVAVDEASQPGDVSESQPPDTPSIGIQPSKKGNRPQPKRANRSGRNQYTRDQPPNSIASPSQLEHSPHSPLIRGNGTDTVGTGGDAQSKQNKLKNQRLERTTWNEIRKPASVMLQYIQQRQLEMADKGGAASSGVQSRSGSTVNGSNVAHKVPDVAQDPSTTTGEENVGKFKDLSAVEMMDHLSRDLVLWQQTVKDF